MTGKKLKTIPARLELFEKYLARTSEGEVLIPADPNMCAYGRNPYQAYDSSLTPLLFSGDLPDYIEPMVRVVVVEGRARSMPLLRKKGTHRDDGLTFTWTAGQNSALDDSKMRNGRDVGKITVQRDGKDVVYDVTFAFVYKAFHGSKRIAMQ